MKYVIAALLILAGVLIAQTTVTPWSGTETQQLLANCTLHNTDSVLCVATDGIEFSYQGAPFVKVGGIGATGPQGPAGPAGAVGPQGPVQGFNSLACGTSNLSNSGLTATSCKQTTP